MSISQVYHYYHYHHHYYLIIVTISAVIIITFAPPGPLRVPALLRGVYQVMNKCKQINIDFANST